MSLIKFNSFNKLIKDNEEYFKELVESISIEGYDYITYLGRRKRLMNNCYYSAILNDDKWNAQLKLEWESFVRNRWKNVTEFNNWCKTKKVVNSSPKFRFSFADYKCFNLYFLKDGIYIKCFARIKKVCHQLEFVSSTDKNNFYAECINYLRFNSGEMQQIVKNILNDKILIEALKYDIGNGLNCIKSIEKWSNSKSVPCYTYIPLGINSSRKIEDIEVESWLLFIAQFATKTMQEQYMGWIYALFYVKDMGREILYLEGEGQIGKSTKLKVIHDYLKKLNPKSVKALADDNHKNDPFKLYDIEYCRLLVLADPLDCEIFKRQEIFNITGNDPIYQRVAYQNPKDIIAYAKILIISNHPPIYNKNAPEQRSRILHIKSSKENVKKVKEIIAKDTNNIPLKERLKKQLPYFISYCEQYYKKYN